MKHTLCIAITLFATSFVSAADNEMEKEPGLFSGKKGAFTLLKTSNRKSEEATMANAETDAKVIENSAVTTAGDISKKEEFSLFKNWKQHKTNNTDDYKEFLLWLEYREMNK